MRHSGPIVKTHAQCVYLSQWGRDSYFKLLNKGTTERTLLDLCVCFLSDPAENRNWL